MTNVRTRIVSLALVAVLSLLLGGAVVLGIDQLHSNNGKSAVISQAVPSTANGVANNSVQDVADLYDKIHPSVVLVTGSARTGAEGLGSGIVLDKQGHILTNNHVVQGFSSIDVTLASGDSYAAKVLGRDPGNDLALIQIDVSADKLQPAVLGDSDKVRIGETVIAVGNPLGLSGSVTEGIVSGLGRTLSGDGGRPLRQLIQSDAAINPGNSGGALFNSKGEVIGVTTAIDNPNGERAFVGIGYSVPINLAKRFLPDLVAGNVVQHPKMGVGLADLTPAEASNLGLSLDRGVLISSVEANSAAARAGLRGGSGGRSGVGDVIVGIDDKQVKSFDDVASYLDTKSVGDTIQLKIVRDGKEMTVRLTLEAWQG